MILFRLSCSDGHGFDSWFKSGEAFDTLAAQALVACPVCGSTKVGKSLMAPAVRPARNAASAATAEQSAPAAGALSTPMNEHEAALAALRRQVEENSEYVGMRFAEEARAIHAGNAPERAIFGETRMDEARKLLEDGVPVAPLPFMPQRKTN
jgi:hypothetical protein